MKRWFDRGRTTGVFNNPAHLLLSLPMALLCAQQLSAQTAINVATVTELRTAISQANAGSGDYVINVAAGNYVLTGAALDNANLSGDLDITKASGNLTIAGAAGAVVDGNGTDRVFHINAGSGVSVTFQNLTIKNGLAVDNGTSLSEARGGGIYNQSGAALTLSNVRLLNNTALGLAGATGADGVALGQDGSPGSPGADSRGGGIYSAGGVLQISQSSLESCQANGGKGGKGGKGKPNFVMPAPSGPYTGGDGGQGAQGGSAQGGGIYLAAGSLLLNEVSIAGAEANGGEGGSGGNGAGGWSFGGYGGAGGKGGDSRGGAIMLGTATGQIGYSTISAGKANAGNGGTGGIGGSSNTGGANVSYAGPGGGGGNGGTGKGGGCYISGGSLSLVNSTLSANQCAAGNGATGGRGGNGIVQDADGGSGGDAGDGWGGGLAVESGSLSINNSTIAYCNALAGNAGAGGAAPPYGGSTAPAQSGPAGSATVSQGGGLYIGLGSVNVSSCLFSNGAAGFGADVYGSLTAGASLFSAAPYGTITPGSGANQVNVNAQLQALASNGGPTLTHALVPTSPAINAGSNTLALGSDQRGTGFARVVGSQADVGAFEYAPPPAPPAAPSVTQPAATLSVNASDYLVQGSAAAGTLVRVYTDLNNNGIVDGLDAIESSQQLAAGVTTFSMLVALTQDSANNFLVTAANAGGESAPADVPTIVEDSMAPAAPIITSPSAPTSTLGPTFSITGNAEAGALVKVYTDLNNDGVINGGDAVVAQFQLAASAVAFAISTPLSASSANNFVVTASDAAANESTPADVPTITETSLPVTAAPSVTSPFAPIAVNAPNFTIEGSAAADSLVRVYSDLNNDGLINGADAVVGQQQLSGGSGTFGISAVLTQNAANNFVVTAQQAGKSESAPVDVATITDNNGVSGGGGGAGGDNGGCTSQDKAASLWWLFSTAILAMWFSLLALSRNATARPGRRSRAGHNH